MSLTGCLFPSSSCKELNKNSQSLQRPQRCWAFHWHGGKQEGQWLRPVSAQTDEFGRREDAPSARTGSWEATGLSTRHWGLRQQPPPPLPHFGRRCCCCRHCACAELVLEGDRLELPGSSLQCCPDFLGHWCRKVTGLLVALAVSSATTTALLPLLMLGFFSYTELPRPSGMDCGSVKTCVPAAVLEEPVS